MKSYSVLMSVYAKENPEFLRQSMQSMYDQTIPTDDFVLVCDGPLNKELDAVIDGMQQQFGERLHVFRLPENHGLGYALNFGVKKCKNELIARMDSDDVSVKDRIEKQLEVFEKMDVDIVGSNTTEYDIDMHKPIANRLVFEKHDDIMKILKKRNPMNHMTVVFRKSKVLAAGEYKEMPFFEDYYLWARMAKKGNIFYNVQEPLVKVRGGVEMCNRRGGINYFKDIVRFQKVLKDNKIISAPRTFINVSERFAVAMMPNFLRNVVYMNFLRGRA